MQVFKTALGSMGYFMLRYLDGVDYPEEVLSEIETTINLLETASQEEWDAFFDAVRVEMKEGDYVLRATRMHNRFLDLYQPNEVWDKILDLVKAELQNRVVCA